MRASSVPAPPGAGSDARPGPSPLLPSQALRRSRGRRPDPRAVAGAVFLGVGLLGTAVGWSRLAAGEPVLVATRTLAAGERVGPGDVAVARVRVADRDLAAAWVPAGERDRVVGQALAAPVQARQPLVRAQLGGRPLPGSDQVAFAVPVGPDTAAGGRVRPGDTVAVYVAWGRGQADAPAPAQELLPAVAVVDVGYGGAGGGAGGVLGGPGAAGSPAAVAAAAGRVPAWLTLAVSREQATALARARSGGELYVALVPPGAGPSATAGNAATAPAVPGAGAPGGARG